MTLCSFRLPTLLVLGLLLGPGIALAEPAELTPEDLELSERVAELYEVIPLDDGILLENRFGDRIASIEISRGRVSVDGSRMHDRAELFERLGDEARLINELSELEDRRLRALFGVSERDELEDEFEAELADEIEALGLEIEEMHDDEEREIPIRIGDIEVGRARISSDAKVVVGETLTVDEDERYRDVVVLGGDLRVEGEVRGNASVMGGRAEIDGRVTGDVTAFGGDVELGSNADVEGDVTSIGGEVERDSGARVGGKISELSIGPALNIGSLGDLVSRGTVLARDEPWFRFGDLLSRIWYVMGLAMLAFLACLVRVLAPTTVDRLSRTAAAEPWKAAFVGFAAVLLFVPVLVTLVVILAISIIGIPLILLLPFVCLGFVLAAFVGFVGVAQRLGLWFETRFQLRLRGPFVALLAGVGLIYGWGLIGKILGLGSWPVTFFAVMLMIFGWLIEVAAWSVGIGAVLLSRFGTSDGASLPFAGPVPLPPGGTDPGLGDEPDLDLDALDIPEIPAVPELPGLPGTSESPVAPEDEPPNEAGLAEAETEEDESEEPAAQTDLPQDEIDELDLSDLELPGRPEKDDEDESDAEPEGKPQD